MGLSRRTVVRAIGGTGLALVGAGGLFAVTRTPERALAPWAAIEDPPPADVRLDAFRHAILAPNPHNRQPWLIKLVGVDEALIFCDLERRLPETDPFDRQILIGFGCFLELARIAAAERGFKMDISAFPDGLPAERLDRRPIARLRFVANPSTTADPLFGYIPVRRSSKQPFDTTRPVEDRILASLVSLGSSTARIATTADAALVETLRTLTWDAWMIELNTARTWQETVDLMRIGRSEIEANPDGVSIGGPILEAMALAGQFSREQSARPGTAAHNGSISRYRPIMATGMAYAWITTEGNARTDQLAVGQTFVRMNLDAARKGLGFHPISQALQEFKEMEPAYRKITGALGARPGQRVQMLARLGYGSLPGRTPRWPLRSKILGA